ncbi:MAG TPA: proline--tRNA ligase [Candidatus Dormibacteraeota bacterium]|jgi:prolyl-tRNA synthetase|nr:proline--tRNA ligase [Candidatus Dormibacteraeota bacterium]
MAEPVEEQGLVKEITPLSVDFDRWYTDVVRKAELADWTFVQGMMVIRPYGFALWEHIQRAFDDMIKASGHENMAFPLLIPQEFLLKEAEHIEGFAPEVAWVTKVGKGMKELEQPLAIRPTSETIIGPIMRKYIQSHRDLPKLTNQWCNVMRWEMRTRLFLRSREFYWQEGHTFHSTAQEAEDEVHLILGYYRDLAQDWLAVPVDVGLKSETEKFAGAVYTTSIEGMMRDGQALQMGTSHYFGQNFSRAYDIGFANRENQRELCYTTSWGVSTRLIGALIMAHGDDSGLILPPRVAPIQVVAVPILRSDEPSREAVRGCLRTLEAQLRGAVRFKVDWREDVRPGEKYAEWEVKGVPLRLEVGPRDVEAGQVVLVDRLRREKRPVPIEGLAERLRAELAQFHLDLYHRAQTFKAEHTADLIDLAAVVDHYRTDGGFVRALWCGRGECEAQVKLETGGVTTRNFPENEVIEGTCVVCGREAKHRVTFAKAY